MSKTKLRVLILINPNASMAQAPLPAITSWFEERCNALIVVGKKKARAKELKEHGENMDLIVIGGGDGTISKALSALLKLKKPFAVLPLGTANDFARTIGVPADPLQAAQIALNGRQHRIDVGTVNDRPFVNVASVGVATKVAKAQSKTQKRRWRVWAYAISLLRAVRNLKPIFVNLEIDGKPTWSGQVYQVSVGNGRYHGGGLTVAEDAAIDDGKLHLYLIYPGRLWQLVASLAHLKFGLAKPDVLRQLKATAVTLNTDRPRSINADGELVTQTPGSFGVLPRALTVMVPADAPAQSPRLGKRE